jgi:hypothetical protein
MLCSIVCFVSLLVLDEIFEWSDAWGWGFVGSVRHRQINSFPFFEECGRLALLVMGSYMAQNSFVLQQ